MTYSRQHKRYLVRSPLRYPGSKAWLFDTLKPMVKGDTFIEAYAGSAILSLNFSRSGKKIILNDLDPSTYSFWLSVRDEPLRLSEMVLNCKISIKEWERQKEIYEAQEISIESGFAFLYMNRTNFSGMARAMPIGGKKQDGTYKMDFRFHRPSVSRWILRASYLLREAEILNQDALSLFDMDGFLYLDPPYLDIDGRIYRYNYEVDDMQSLLDRCKSRTDPWALSHSPSDLLDRELKGYDSLYIDHRYGMNTPAEKGSIECFWSNCSLPAQAQLAQF